MDDLENTLVSYFCGSKYEKCSNKRCKNCDRCSFRLTQILPLKKYLEENGIVYKGQSTVCCQQLTDYKQYAKKLLSKCGISFDDSKTTILSREIDTLVKSNALKFLDLVEFHSVCQFTEYGPEYTITHNGLCEILREDFNMKNEEIRSV